MLVDQSDQEEATENYEVLENNMKGKKRTLSDRLQEPIKVRKAGRCKKVNVTSWRNQVLTMKKKASRVQICRSWRPTQLSHHRYTSLYFMNDHKTGIIT